MCAIYKQLVFKATAKVKKQKQHEENRFVVLIIANYLSLAFFGDVTVNGLYPDERKFSVGKGTILVAMSLMSKFNFPS